MTTKETLYIDCMNRRAFEWYRDVLANADSFLWGFNGMIATKATREEIDKLAGRPGKVYEDVEILTYTQFEENFRLLRLSNDVIFMVRHQNKKDLNQED